MELGTAGSVVLAAIALVTICVASFYAVRFAGGMKASADSAEAWKRERDAEVAHRKRLEYELEVAKQKIDELERRVDELSQRPDLRSIEIAIERHEDRANQRMEKLLATLEALVKRIETSV